ncbi:hypothetical protein MN116_006493 [Schistosoma mekongi]|uniref:Ig-like domain-containing protein n=1 Tax=Schistosoma mekongi TaxID=38744 RepID=A0AAE1ZB24_SCHME|nr:hypothetical protein MN116_006493 [Schistosoma mekongi]
MVNYYNSYIKVILSSIYCLSYSLSSSITLSTSSSSSSYSLIYSIYIIFYLMNKFLLQYYYVECVQGCSIFYQIDFKWKKALCDSHINKLHNIPLNLPINLIELRILHQSIEIIHSNSLEHLIHLETLQIESCQLKQIELNTFNQLIALKHLNLRNNSLKLNSFSFPVELLRNLPNLLSLNLAENPIDLIPDAFFTNLYNNNNNKLQYLWLNSVKSNGIHFESNTIKSLKYLRLLDLSYTGLHTLHKSNELILSSMLYLNEFYLHGNPWLCDCKISWLKLWYLNKSPKNLQFKQNLTQLNGKIEINEPICYKPNKLKGKLIFSKNQLTSIQFNELDCKPEIFTLNQNITQYFNRTLLLSCDYYAIHINDLIWYKDNQLLRNTSNYIIQYKQIGSNYYSQVFITLTTGEHTGTWSCVLNTNNNNNNNNNSTKYRVEFNVSILNTNGNILYPNDNQSLMYKVFQLFGVNNDLMNWIYAGIAMISLFIMLALISIGIFCCCSEQPHSNLTNTLINTQLHHKKTESLINYKQQSMCNSRWMKCINRRNHYETNKKIKNNKDDSVSSLLVTINDEQKIIDKSELQLISSIEDNTVCIHSNVNTFTSSTALSTTTTYVNSNVNLEKIDYTTSIKNNDENRLLNIFCCPTNATHDVQMFTIPTINSPSSSSSRNFTNLTETVTNAENHVLVSCDSPEPKLLIANGVTPCSNITSINFSTCIQQQSLNITPQQSSTSWDSSKVNPISEFPATNTSSNQIIIETSKPCPVHGIMKMKQMNTNNNNNTAIIITTTDSNYISSIKQSTSNYQKMDSIYWDHFNSTAVLTSPHFSNYVLLNSQSYDNNNNNTTINSSTDKNVMEVFPNYTKTSSLLRNDVCDFNVLHNANLNEMNIHPTIDSLLSGSCPVHGNHTMPRTNDHMKQNDNVDVVLGNHRNLKRHHFNKSVICDQSDDHLNQNYHRILDNQEISFYSSTDTNENEEIDNQSNYVHNGHHGLLMNSMKPEKVIYTSTDETETQSESSLSEKSLHSDCASTSCPSSTSSTTASISSINRRFKYVYPSNHTGLNSICSSLSNQINLATAAAADATEINVDNSNLLQQQSPPSLEFCPSSDSLNNHRLRSSSNRSYINDAMITSKCPLHSLSMKRRSLSGKIYYDTYNYHGNILNSNNNNDSISTLRVTTLPTRFKKINNNNNTSSINNYSNNMNNMASIRKFSSQHTIQLNYPISSSSICLSTTQSLDKFHKLILRPGSKHKLDDTETDSDDDDNNNNTSEENNFQI